MPPNSDSAPRSAPDSALSCPAISSLPVSAVRVIALAAKLLPLDSVRSPLRTRTPTTSSNPPRVSEPASVASGVAKEPASREKLPPNTPAAAFPVRVDAMLAPPLAVSTTAPPELEPAPATSRLAPELRARSPPAVIEIRPPGVPAV